MSTARPPAAFKGASDPALLRETIDLLRTLVGFDTTSSKSNKDLIDWVANYLRDFGIEPFVQHGHEPGKFNLLATIGPADVPGVMLAGHSDVVPVTDQNWTSDPFTLTERDGRLHGRGSSDMKAYIACALACVPRFQREQLRTPVHIALSYNEETDMQGMRVLTRHFDAMPVRPAVCVIGEPTMMQVVVAHKGAAIYQVRVRGRPMHSSLRHRGVSAVEVAAEIITYINALQRSLQGGEANRAFEFPYTSLHVGQIQGGTAHNITARECTFSFEVRAMPGTSATGILNHVRDYCNGTLLPAMRAISEECSITIEEVIDAPALEDSGNRHLARAIMPLCGCASPHRVSFATEGGILQSVGIPTVICGPGDIQVAHRADEYVEPEQLARCNDFLWSLCDRLVDGTWPPAAGPG